MAPYVIGCAAVSTLLRVAYDGASFHGFARQAPGPAGPIRTVQGELVAALVGTVKDFDDFGDDAKNAASDAAKNCRDACCG